MSVETPHEYIGGVMRALRVPRASAGRGGPAPARSTPLMRHGLVLVRASRAGSSSARRASRAANLARFPHHEADQEPHHS